MILAVNIGNTNVRVAIGNEQPTRDAVASWDEIPGPEGFLHFLEQKFGGGVWAGLEGCMVASVVPEQTPVVAAALQKKMGRPPKRVDPQNCPGLDLSAYKDVPGEDRVACCAGALQIHRPPLILLDFGTATTVNVIDAERRFLGGAILAGLHISLEALAGRTAQLPLVEELSSGVQLIGERTRECMVSGAVLGEAFAAEGYVTRIKSTLGPYTPVIVTGGHAPVILPHCNFEHTHVPNLLLRGLFTLYREL